MQENDWFKKELREWMLKNPIKLTENELLFNFGAKGNINPFYGKKHSEEWKKNTSERMKGNKNTAGYTYKREHVEKRAAAVRKPVIIFDKYYSSGKDAAKDLKKSPSQIIRYIKSGKGYYI